MCSSSSSRGMPGPTFLAAFLEAVLQAAVGELGDDDQLPVDDFDPLERQEERMPHALDALKGLQLAQRAIFVEKAVDELDRLDQAARRFGCPDLAVTAGTDALHQLVARNRLVRFLQHGGHGGTLPFRRVMLRADCCSVYAGCSPDRNRNVSLVIWHTKFAAFRNRPDNCRGFTRGIGLRGAIDTTGASW